MCGIAGFQGDFRPELLTAMVRAVGHRGPDDTGIGLFPADRVGLGQARLSIIDLSPDGHQPMTNEDGTLWLVYNGELYNYRELRQELEAKGHRFKSRTDSEVFLHLYEEEGTEMLRRFNGIFAFALYDSVRRRLFLARDQLGVKPLYVAATRCGVLFASELKALLRSAAVDRTLDLEGMHQYLTFLWAPAPRTMLTGVEKVPPGHALLIGEGGITRKWCYYRLPYDGTRLPGSEAELTATLAEKVRTAVDRQMMSDVPVGAFLSGGLDSSAVVAMMRQAQPTADIPCYSIGFAGGEDTEGCPPDLPFARKAASHLGVRLCEIEVTPAQLIRRLPEMLFFLDEPQADPAPINALFIAERARQDGIKVLLSGAGGDDLLTGYRRHHALTFDRWLDLIPTVARRLASRLAGRLAGGQSATLRRVQKVLANVHLAPEARLISYFKWSTDELRWSLLSPACRDRLDGILPEQPLLESLARIPEEQEPLHRMLYLDALHFLADHNLNYTDKTGMRHGVETRVPLLDLELVDFAAHLPTGFKQKGSMGKAIFKRAMEPFLPREIIYRPKTGFGAPLRRWLREDLREMLQDLLAPAALARRGLFDPAGVTRLIERDRQGLVDGGYTLFSLLCIELWCRIFIDGQPCAGVPDLGTPLPV